MCCYCYVIQHCIHSSDQASSRDKVVLYYGVRNAEHMAYAEQLDAWRQAGVQVVPVLSEEGHGYVQDVFKSVRPRAFSTFLQGVGTVMYLKVCLVPSQCFRAQPLHHKLHAGFKSFLCVCLCSGRGCVWHVILTGRSISQPGIGGSSAVWA